jgi:chaperone required for assembly of F1-ATPase
MVGDEAFNQRALNSLVNLFASCQEARQKAVENEVIERVMDVIRCSKANIDLAIMALVNITVEDSACAVLLQKGKLQGLYLRRLMQHWRYDDLVSVFD